MEIQQRLEELTGLCGDHSCIFGPPKGMGTNGGCRCSKNVKVHMAVQLLRRVTKEHFEDCTKPSESGGFVTESTKPSMGLGPSEWKVLSDGEWKGTE
jgi:hypothetical protein